MTKRNSRREAAANSPADAPSRAAPEAPETPMLIEPPPPTTGKQKLVLAVMIAVVLGWMAFLAVLAMPKQARAPQRAPIQEEGSIPVVRRASGVA